MERESSTEAVPVKEKNKVVTVTVTICSIRCHHRRVHHAGPGDPSDMIWPLGEIQRAAIVTQTVSCSS